MSNKYGSNVFSPTSKLPNSLPPPSIKIVFLDGVSIKVLSPCPTSMKYIFTFEVGSFIKYGNIRIKISIIKISF